MSQFIVTEVWLSSSAPTTEPAFLTSLSRHAMSLFLRLRPAAHNCVHEGTCYHRLVEASCRWWRTPVFWGSTDGSVFSCTEPLCWQFSPAYHPTEHPGICACGLGGVEKQVVGVTPCDKVLDQFPVLLLSTSGAAHNCCAVCKLLYMTELWVVLEVWGVQFEQYWREHSFPCCRPQYQIHNPLVLPPVPPFPPSTPQCPQSYILRSSSQIVCNPGVWFSSHPWQFVPEEQWLNGVKGYNHCTRGQNQIHPDHQYWKTKPNSMNC